MEFNEMINSVLYTVLTVILPVVLAYVVKLIKTKIEESDLIKVSTKNEVMSKIIKDAVSDVMDSVLYVNQIYVNSLKARGEFTEDAQLEAFKMAYAEASSVISDSTKKIIEEMYGSFDKWLSLKIESSVNTAKK